MSMRAEEVPEEGKTVNLIFKKLPKQDIRNMNSD
jgi:hypothetical protein